MTDQIIAATAVPTLWDLFRERVRRTPDRIAYREYDVAERGWRDTTWAEISARVDRFRSGLARVGPRAGDRVAILLPNGVDWVCFDLAAHSLGLVVVGLYPHETAATNAYILGHSDARLVLLDSDARWTALAAFASELGSVEHVWIRGEPLRTGDDLPCRRATLADILAAPSEPATDHRGEPQDIATLIYTSGTTGRPKGVMLSHFALLWNAHAAGAVLPPRPDDVFLSVLPLAHAFERTVGYYLPLMAGCTVAYARSPQNLAEDLLTVRPTAMLGVPLLFERMTAAIEAKVATSWIGRKLLDATVAAGWSQFLAKQRHAKPGLVNSLQWCALDWLVATRVLAVFGGRMRVAISGGAPLPPEVSRTLLGLGLPIVEGYGLTEAGPVVAANGLENNWPGSVGRPLSGVQVTLGSRSELLVRSPAAMAGYWKDEARTRQMLDSTGWLASGDIAELDEQGRIFIRGRLTDVVVLSIGEKVEPNVVEAALCRDPLFRQAAVVGDRRPFIAALVVVNTEAWQVFAAERGLDPANPNSPAGKLALLGRIAAAVAELPRYAQPRACHFTLAPWTIEAGLLTPTLKVKRDDIVPLFAKEIDALYAASAQTRPVRQSGRSTR